ncbi:DJ-1/PfpI family protein [Marinitenerispora sediminis]|uniref:Thiamine biosynthesis protein ThiJ n=1 Tax=Marinitenerispora sediminis TaxID=1931232 RepID=A0A368T1N3_9ACTN|nr:DJ-1/PfpI family protein [Marinitenerispora sediminis]RCV54007.1 thiamine biosynthesis protein ThiJ [Marinitenerispora sediminis]RCV57783.1 thiamine biosynthesis protein ThiJ [Marinitenerispora sediminis]RCV59528.1 thiamine biosynthesis protein ThiJ [Marinitenerispora sediminis]
MTKTIAYVLYPGLTALDLIGPLTVTAALDGEYESVVVARDLAALDTDAAVRLGATATFDQVTAPHVVVVPGGTAGTFAACADEELLRWLRTASAAAEVTASVCTGSLVLGAAGLLEGRRATTHWGFRHLLPKFGAVAVAERWVRDGDVLTAAGVSAGIDMALQLVRELAGEQAARLSQLVIEYDPEPPLGPIDWSEVDTAAFAPFGEAALREGLADHPELLARLTG